MSQFQELDPCEDIKVIIKSAFDSDMPVNGSWGYTQSLCTVITSKDMPHTQIEHMFASIRANLEMSMTQNIETRYGSINLNEVSREIISVKDNEYHKVLYAISAMKETVYHNFIKEYKENYGKETFDLTLHFQKRKEATIHREVLHWFKIN